MALADYRFIYLHGFASSPGSNKATKFADAFAARKLPLDRLDLNQPSFQTLTISRQLEQVAQATTGAPPGSVVLIGSSLGGYTSALFAASQPAETNPVHAMVLMAPAFDFHPRWCARIGQQDLKRWEEAGTIPMQHYGEQRELPLDFTFMSDAAKHVAYPQVSCPCLVVHGRQDDTVDVEVSLNFAERCEGVELELIEGDHTLGAPVGWIIERSFQFLEHHCS